MGKKEYSNFITPPDFVNDKLHTVTIIDATPEEVILLGKFCQYSEQCFNIYLYRLEMQNFDWLEKAILLSDAIIINNERDDFTNYLKLDKVYYYGTKNYLSPAHKVNNLLQYFETVTCENNI